MTFNTRKPVPSTDPRDLYDNAENLDKLVNGANPFYADRLGKLRESWSGMENSFNNAQEGRETAFTLSQADKESRFQAFLVSSGYVSKGDYAAGVVLEERNEYVAVDAATTGTTAGLYRPGPGATLPLTLTGTWATDSANLVLLGDDVLRQDLAGDNGADMVGFLSPLAGAVRRTIGAKLADSVHVADFGASASNTPAANRAAIQAALDASDTVLLGDEVYEINGDVYMSRAGQSILGTGRQRSHLKASADFQSSTRGGATAKCLVWYQAPGSVTLDDWVEGGKIAGFSVWGNGQGVEGVRLNRVCCGNSLQDLRIVDTTIGIHGTKWGWATKFDNIYVLRSSEAAIRLTTAYNGCTFTNCFLYGGDVVTPVLLDIQYDSYGNSFTGGAIEGGAIGVNLVNSQIAISGVDFEAITTDFIKISGLFGEGSGLLFSAPPSTVGGCTFVGVPSNGGVTVIGGAAEVHGNFWVNNEAAPPTNVFCLNGVSGGDATDTGFPQPCISESNNVLRGWNQQLASGVVFSRFKRLASEALQFPATPRPSNDPNTLDAYVEGFFTPTNNSGDGGAFSGDGYYTRIGNLVIGSVRVLFPTSASQVAVRIAGLPFPVGGSSARFGVGVSWSDAGAMYATLGAVGSSELILYGASDGANTPLAQVSGKTVALHFAYQV